MKSKLKVVLLLLILFAAAIVITYSIFVTGYRLGYDEAYDDYIIKPNQQKTKISKFYDYVDYAAEPEPNVSPDENILLDSIKKNKNK